MIIEKENKKKKSVKAINLKFNYSLAFSLIALGLFFTIMPDFFFSLSVTQAVKWSCYLLGFALFSYYTTRIENNKSGFSKAITGISIIGLGTIIFMLDKTNIINRIVFSLFILGGSIPIFYGFQVIVQNFIIKTRNSNSIQSKGNNNDSNSKIVSDLLAVVLVILQIVFLLFEQIEK